MKRKTLFNLLTALILASAVLLLAGGEAQAAILCVTNLNPDGPGSLAQAVIDADPGDTITFCVSGTRRSRLR